MAGLAVGGTPVIDSNRLISLRAYTFATVPSATSQAGKIITISDRNYRPATSDGANWRFSYGTIIS